MILPQTDPAAIPAAPCPPRRSRSARPVPPPDGGLAAEVAALRAELAEVREDIDALDRVVDAEVMSELAAMRADIACVHEGLRRTAIKAGSLPPASLPSGRRTASARLTAIEEGLAAVRELAASLAERMDGHDESAAIKADALRPPAPLTARERLAARGLQVADGGAL